MFTWIGFIGKSFCFLAEKLASKKLDDLGDRKASACEALMRTYISIAEIEGSTSQILHDARATLEDGNVGRFEQAVRLKEGELRFRTTELAQATVQLGPILEIFDPTLHLCLMSVCAWKFNILYEASRSVVIEKEEGRATIAKVRFKKPLDRLLEIDMEEHYRWLKTHPNHAHWEDLEWPQTLLINNKIEDAFVDSEIAMDESGLQTIEDLVRVLGPHMKQLSNARKKLREMIRTSFDIGDVLYVSSRIGQPSNWP